MIIKCEAGKHYYNTEDHDGCPFCRELKQGTLLFSIQKEDAPEEETRTLNETESDLHTI